MLFPMYADTCPGVMVWWCDLCDRIAPWAPKKPEHTCEVAE